MSDTIAIIVFVVRIICLLIFKFKKFYEYFDENSETIIRGKNNFVNIEANVVEIAAVCVLAPKKRFPKTHT